MNKQSRPQLKLIYRVEPGCLGPQGIDYIDGFCDFSAHKLMQEEASIAALFITPRKDKALDEMQYQLDNKRLSDEQVERYFKRLGHSQEDYEERIFKKIATLIEQYLGRA